MFDRDAHPHIHLRKIAGPPTVHAARVAMSGDGSIARFNSKLGLKVTLIVGTMWAAYLFAILGITAMYGAFTNKVAIVLIAGAISGYFLQLVLLPIIIVGQNVQASAADKRAEATFKDVDAILHGQGKVHDHLDVQDRKLKILENDVGEVLRLLKLEDVPGLPNG